jgi:hypothetical protein
MCKCRFLLPVLLVLPSAGLLSWQAHNNRIIDSMGMAWDTGALPMWPYQTPEILLVILNAPAYLVAAPIYAVFGLRTSEERAPILLAAIALLWFFVGRSLDFGLIPQRWGHYKKGMLGFFLPVAVVSLYGCLRIVTDAAAWWSRYGEISLSSYLILARVVGLLPWCAVIASVSIRIVARCLRPSVSAHMELSSPS